MPVDCFQIVSPTRGLQMGDHTSFGQEETQYLQCLTLILAMYVVEDVSMSGYSDFGNFQQFWSVFHFY